jgi:ATP-dependent Clp protease adaptor protein ClpS
MAAIAAQFRACAAPGRRNMLPGVMAAAGAVRAARARALARLVSIECLMPPNAPDRPSGTPPTPPSAPVRDGGGDGAGAVVAERQTARTKPPALYQVVMLNDDYTPMEFVVMVLQQYFQHDLDTSTHIMLKIHHEGRGVCGVFPKDIAATKVELVLAAARRDGHPLQCIMEAA